MRENPPLVLASELTYRFWQRLLVLLHLLAVVVAFAPFFANALMNLRLKQSRRMIGDYPEIARLVATNSVQIFGPALVLAGLFGMGAVATMDAYNFKQVWVSVALAAWFVMLFVVFVLLLPAERKLGKGERAADSKISMYTGIVHLLFLVMLVDMVWRPGAKA